MAIEIPTAYTPGPWEVEDNHGAQIERSRYENGAFVVYAPMNASITRSRTCPATTPAAMRTSAGPMPTW